MRVLQEGCRDSITGQTGNSNVTRMVDSPNERVLAVCRAGHPGWLRHEVASDPTLRLRKLADFVE